MPSHTTRPARNNVFSLISFCCLLHTLYGATIHQGGGSPGMMMPSVVNLDAKCGRSGMTVHIFFDQPFPGVIYSKGHYAEENCHYVTEKNVGRTNFTFLVPVNGCGTEGQLEDPTPTRDMYFENTIIIQLDPLITEVWDEARSLKCLWPHTLMRQVQASPIKVVDPNFINVELDERSVNTLMSVQKGGGKSLLNEPITGYVYMGEETSLVFYVQDPSKNMDANVLNCTATTIGGKSEQLIDQFGCLTRPDLMTYFDKSRTSNGVKADLMLYSYLKGLNVEENSKFSIKCQLQICKGACTTPCVNGPVYSGKRKRRSVSIFEEEILLQQPADNDIDHAILIVERKEIEELQIIPVCRLSKSVLISGLTLLAIVIVLSILSCYLALKLSKVNTHQQKSISN